MQRRDDSDVSGPVIEPLPIATPVTGLLKRRESVGVDAVEVVTAAAFDEFADRLRSFAISATRDGATADDIVQEAFVRLITELREGRRPDNLGGWLYRVVSNLIISRGRRKSIVNRLRQFLPAGSSEPSPEDLSITSERDRTLAIALSRLSPDARVALLLAARGMAPTEIAVVLKRTPGATRTYLCRARVRLRDELAALGVEAAE